MGYPPDYTHRHPGLGYVNVDTLLLNDQAANPSVTGEIQRNGTYPYYYDGTRVVPLVRRVGARVYNDANISVDNATLTALTFNTEREDTDAFHSLISATGRLTATLAGDYIIGGNVTFASDADGLRMISIRLNGTTYIARHRVTAINGADHDMAICTRYTLALNDYVELVVLHEAGAALNVLVAANYSPEFWWDYRGP